MRVMVVTHDAKRRTRMTELLRERGYELSVPPHRQDVLQTAKQTTPHVIVLDLYVAGPNGAETLRRLRAEGYTGKVVVLAGSSAGTTLSDCWRAGVDQVVGGVQANDGPFDAGHVEVAIRASFQKEIAQRAHELWVQLGRPKGQDQQNWHQAEGEIYAQLGMALRDPSAQQVERASTHNQPR
jgi:DNA-binding response OmpR family regulator